MGHPNDNAFVALLRGINVSGHKPMPMAALRNHFTAAGYRQVQTYIQSGNVYFETRVRDARKLETDLSQRIHTAYGWDVPVMVRSLAELAEIVARSPFAAPDRSCEQVSVGFLRGVPPAAAAADLMGRSQETDRFVVDGTTLYIWQRKDVPKNLLDKLNLERLLQTDVTLRNWATTVRLSQWPGPRTTP
ncbi:MAG: hypothetical protein RIS76_2753 [Verrucomicrobiota bacterium]|jgi:uncharacterized protein (DUF1697 family)